MECKSAGIEINKSRVELSYHLRALILTKHFDTREWAANLFLYHNDASLLKQYQVDGQDASHIFMFDKVFDEELLTAIIAGLNNTAFRVLVTSQTSHKMK